MFPSVDRDAVVLSAPLKGFSTSSAIPQTMDGYLEYRQRAVTFIEARNRRILQSCRFGDRSARRILGCSSARHLASTVDSAPPPS